MTDEQIEKALKFAVSDLSDCAKEQIFAYINRLKDENERLAFALKLAQIRANDAEERISAYEKGEAIILTADRYAKLEEAEIESVVKKYEVMTETSKRVRKETAKEILSELNDKAKNSYVILDEFRIYVIKPLFEKYGVEVEE